MSHHRDYLDHTKQGAPKSVKRGMLTCKPCASCSFLAPRVDRRYCRRYYRRHYRIVNRAAWWGALVYSRAVYATMLTNMYSMFMVSFFLMRGRFGRGTDPQRNRLYPKPEQLAGPHGGGEGRRSGQRRAGDCGVSVRLERRHHSAWGLARRKP